MSVTLSAQVPWYGTPASEVLDMIERHRPAWERDAACKEHHELDFLTPGRGAGGRRARETALEAVLATCSGCLVREECLAAPLADPYSVGVWGGTLEEEREELRRDPAAVAAKLASSCRTAPRSGADAELGAPRAEEPAARRRVTEQPPAPDAGASCGSDAYAVVRIGPHGERLIWSQHSDEDDALRTIQVDGARSRAVGWRWCVEALA